MNKVILKGHVGQDPRVKTFEDGNKVAMFTLATTERGYKTQDGREIPEVTDWHNIVARRGVAKVCEQYVKKGTPLLIVGRLKTREYEDKDKNKRYITEVWADEMEMLGKKDEKPEPKPETYAEVMEGTKNDLPF